MLLMKRKFYFNTSSFYEFNTQKLKGAWSRFKVILFFKSYITLDVTNALLRYVPISNNEPR